MPDNDRAQDVHAKDGPASAQPQSGGPPEHATVVGIGASAGGLKAFESFFSGMPGDTAPEMAFVLVQHLAPDHHSMLTELIGRYTNMQVYEVQDGMSVHPNCAYIIPPNRDMKLVDGRLKLVEPEASRGHRMPIDFFFRSLAESERERAIGIILSGTGSDGTLGARAIKGEGGLVLVQSPESTDYDGMPNSAIHAGLADLARSPEQMLGELARYAAHAFGTQPHDTVLSKDNEQTLKGIMAILRSNTGHDFSQYKRSTIRRRIDRRMAVHQLHHMDEYLELLRQDSSEVHGLFRDMLIGVTSFFRDPDSFEALKTQAIPEILSKNDSSTRVRIWVPGCYTGEEAYSLAILIAEQQETDKNRAKVQIFATDIDSHAISVARAGVYPASIAADVPPNRLARYFSQEDGGDTYQINKSIRDMLIFSEQNLIDDPPFSRIDLISCRNLLIYLNASLQERIIPMFHYSLNPEGFLLLGKSETIGEYRNLFTTVDPKHKLYGRLENASTGFTSSANQVQAAVAGGEVEPPRAREARPVSTRSPMQELIEQALLAEVIGAAVLVNARGDIEYLHGRSGMYLEPAPGRGGGNNVLEMAREGLQRELTTALFKASHTHERISCPGIRVKTNGDWTRVDVTVRPVSPPSDSSSDDFLYLVVLKPGASGNEPAASEDDRAAPESASPHPGVSADDTKTGKISEVAVQDESADSSAEARIAALEKQLQAKEEYLQSIIEEHNTTTEELRSYNEEMQSMNEELQSTNEELETSKEELQSLNEELSTVNAELETKVADLTQTRNDMNNLLAATGIATVFVDLEVRILRFTPAATEIINLIQSDFGRPVGHIASNLEGYDRLTSDVQEVLDNLSPKEIEVKKENGDWYLLRIQAYRTLNNVVEGAVITFIDISESKRLRAELAKYEGTRASGGVSEVNEAGRSNER